MAEKQIIGDCELYCGDCMDILPTVPQVDLIMADPPYFEVCGDFDFKWKDFDEYLHDVDGWASRCADILSRSGTVFWFGAAKRIAYSQIILDKKLSIINSLVWNKGVFMGLEESDGLRSFAPCSERILMYGSSAHDLTGLQAVEKEFIAPRNPFALELKRARTNKNVSINQVAEYGKFYGNVNHGGAVTNWERGYNVPLKEQWKVLCEFLPIERTEYEELRTEYEELRTEYEELRTEYEHMRRPFNNIYSLKEILNFSNDAAKNKAVEHETVKPINLITALIETCSRIGSCVIDPFMGSGTTGVACVKLGRKFIGIELEPKYFDIACERIQAAYDQPDMFVETESKPEQLAIE